MIPKNHPRYNSLILREKIKNAYKLGYLADSGMIAHGRGEAFDYLIGEKTSDNSKIAIEASVAMILLAENPVLSVNGNTTALVIDDIIKLAKEINGKIEINLFYRTKERVDIIANLFKEKGWENILGTNNDELLHINNIESPRSTASKNGIYNADVVLVPLEDGDRAEILVNSRKKVISIDLNPMSRTSKKSTISIIDNVTRVIPSMIEIAKNLKNKDKDYLKEIVNNFSNEDNLKGSLKTIDLVKGKYK
ncbi:4-phosphopantoate--beta-alanine ligase [Methanobrevibacter filiformis]|uniref:4-phosphopantoate--beta-alanine ligase n=1 Tax=Methanobrevibacter filiformis TaxID=55758 RepID=A0A166EZS1_9EURY|nr:4-phosphopantoate--beta-alanine ligase [Methanobrevibacter filiformis]KZX17176.1 hypothetical protein MBFIL_03140 [Methanobrevibacter filiformis]